MDKLNIVEQREIMGKTFTIYGSIENPLFLAKEVASWIEHSQVVRMVESVDAHEKVMRNVHTLGGLQGCWFLTEDGLYEVLMQSRKPIAKQFKTKVKEILRTIRKTGTYSTSQQHPLSTCIEDLIIQQATLLKELRLKVESQEQRINEMKHVPFSHCHAYLSSEAWLKSRCIPFQRDFLWGYSRRCAKYSRKYGIEIREIDKKGYTINAYRDDVLEFCFGKKPQTALLPKPKQTIEIRDYLRDVFDVIPRAERETMIKCFSQWHFTIPDKFKGAIWESLYASVYGVPIRKIG